jgi:tetratricopeptide (TPR) repeat protein
MNLNPFKQIIFTQRTWIQLLFALIFSIIDLFLFLSTYKHIKVYLYYTKALEKIAVNEVGTAAEKLTKVSSGFFPYANLVAASIELEKNSPKTALEILDKINPELQPDKKALAFTELLKAISHLLVYYESPKNELLITISGHLNNATNYCPECLEVNIVYSLLSLLQDKKNEAYQKLKEAINSTNYTIQKNAIYIAFKHLGEIDLSLNKFDKAQVEFQNASIYNPNDTGAFLKYLYSYLKTYTIKGEKQEIEDLKNAIYRKIYDKQVTFSKEEKRLYSMILTEIAKLAKSAGNEKLMYENIEASLKQDPCNFEGIVILNEMYEKKGETQNIEEVIAKKLYFTSTMEESDFYNCQAINYFKTKKDIQKALLLLEKAKEKNPSNAKVYSNLAILYLRTNQRELAKNIIEEAEKKGISSPIFEKIKGVLAPK